MEWASRVDDRLHFPVEIRELRHTELPDAVLQDRLKSIASAGIELPSFTFYFSFYFLHSSVFSVFFTFYFYYYDNCKWPN